VEKPDIGLSWFEKLFGIRPSQPTQPVPVITPKPSQPEPSQQHQRFNTYFGKNNTTMLTQLREAEKYAAFIEEACRRYYFLQPAILCGIGSRESHWGLALRPPGPGGRGDFSRRRPRGQRRDAIPPDGAGYGRGLMQIDYDWHEFARSGRWYSARDNILYACTVLEDARNFFQKRINLNDDLLLRATLAAYNAGATATLNAIEAGNDVDSRTTGRDYSQDVLNRSGWFQLHGWR